jgi:hypothetical protein
MAYKLGTVMGHVGHAPPETECWAILKMLGVDVALAKRAVHKLYFETKITPGINYDMHHDVFFIPNDTKHGTAFAIKYGTKIDEC